MYQHTEHPQWIEEGIVCLEEKAEEVTEKRFDYVLDVNLKGAMFQAQAAARHMIRQGTGGKQVHIGSVRTLLALRGRRYAAYCASKVVDHQKT